MPYSENGSLLAAISNRILDLQRFVKISDVSLINAGMKGISNISPEPPGKSVR